RANGVSGDRDPGDHVGRAATKERPRERAARVRVVPVRDDVRLTARRVPAHGAQLLDEREAGPTAAPKATALDDREKLLELERSRTRQGSGRGAVEEPWRGASRHRSVRARGGPRPRGARRARAAGACGSCRGTGTRSRSRAAGTPSRT